MRAGLVAGHTGPSLDLPLVGQGEVQARVGQGRVGGVEILLQILFEETVIGEGLLVGREEEEEEEEVQNIRLKGTYCENNTFPGIWGVVLGLWCSHMHTNFEKIYT